MAKPQPPAPGPVGRMDFQTRMGISSMIAQEYVGKQMHKLNLANFKEVIKNGFLLSGMYIEALDTLGARLFQEEVAFQEKMVAQAKAGEPQIIVPFPSLNSTVNGGPGPHGGGPA